MKKKEEEEEAKGGGGEEEEEEEEEGAQWRVSVVEGKATNKPLLLLFPRTESTFPHSPSKPRPPTLEGRPSVQTLVAFWLGRAARTW
jgi:hypothetical protein